MTGKERKEFIRRITEAHADYRERYQASDVGALRYVLFGQMLGLEYAAHAAGLKELDEDLQQLRKAVEL